MKVFDKGGKINFVDENNVFVGYDTNQSCCENADYFISTKKENEDMDSKDFNLEPYSFDKDGFEEVDSPKGLDAGGMVRFRLVAPDLPDLYLHLYNAHNGYYGHGFEAKIGDTSWQDGCL